MTDKSWFWSVVIGIIYLAILFVLVKPSSPAATAVQSISGALSALVTTAAGNTSS